jgi:peptide/nickel transport system substrate-binding protein
MSSRLSSLVFLFCLALLLLVSCTGGRKTPSDTLVIGLGSAPSTLDPRFATDANGMRISGLIFNSLVRPGENFEPAPDAAEKWTYKDRVFTFELRQNLKFHNGRSITVDDILFSFAQFRESTSPFASILELITDVQARKRGDGAILVTLKVKNYSDKFLISDLPAVRLLPKAETLKAGPDFTKVLMGTGPYKFVNADSSTIQLEGLTSRTKRLTFKVIRDDFTRFQKMLKGEVDIIQSDIPADKVEDFEKRPQDFQVLRYPGLTMTYVLLNFKDPLLKTKVVRQALAQTLKRQEIITHKLRGLGVEATSLLTPNNPYFNSELANPGYDLPAATSAIDKLGYTGHKITLKTSNQPQAVDNGKVLAHQMSASGLSINLQSYEWATFYDDVKKGNFQMATMRWVGTIDPDLYRIAFHSKETPPGRNRGSYSNSRLDSLLERSAATEDRRERKKIIHEVQKIAHEDLVIIPLWYDQQVAVARKNILNYRPVQTGEFHPFIEVGKTQP